MSAKDDAELDLDLDNEELDGADEGTEKEPTPEELKASVANLEKALKKANREAAKLRNEKKAADEPKGDEKPAETKGEDKYKRSAVAAAARAELKDAGFTGTKEQAAKLSKLLDLDDLDVDDDGEVEGLEDAVADLKEQFPALFAGEKAADEKPKAPKVDASRKPVLGSVATSKDPIAEERYRRLFGDPGRKPARR
jgi:hypothetical protein